MKETKNVFEFFEALANGEYASKQPPMDIAICECGKRLKVDDCISETDSEGWEYPSYTVHYCPCEKHGFIDDYDVSSEAIAEFNYKRDSNDT